MHAVDNYRDRTCCRQKAVDQPRNSALLSIKNKPGAHGASHATSAPRAGSVLIPEEWRETGARVIQDDRSVLLKLALDTRPDGVGQGPRAYRLAQLGE
ncbi:MAG: hypothetical protein SV862_04135, partial [Pseudomonadota bacterium]|nr:hypothetical protein [Pseudomonadota bacterium]